MVDWKAVLSFNGRIRQRFVLVFMMLMAIVNTYMMRVSLNIALVKMCKPVQSNATMITGAEFAAGKEHEFDWDRKTQGYIKSGFYWGYVVTHIPGGALADHYGGKWVLFSGLVSTTVFTLVIPVTARYLGSVSLIILRVLTGLGEGVVFPCIGVLLAKWSPMKERSRLGAITLSGAQLGTVITSALTGLTLSAWQWDYTFYFFGILGVLFCFFWSILVFSVPESNPYISERELQYLNETVAPKKRVDPVPWIPILKSWQVWGLVIGHIGHDWGLFTMIHELPAYLNDVLHFNIRTNGLLNALPYLIMWIASILLGIVADTLTTRKILRIVNVRRIFTLLASVVPGLGMALLTVPEDPNWAVAIIVIGMAGMGGYYPGMRINALDITKNYAGTVMAFHNGLGALAGIASPILFGYIVPNSTKPEWFVAYLISAGILVITCIFYCFVARDIRQVWDYQHDEEKPEPPPKGGWKFWKRKEEEGPTEGGEGAISAAPAAK